MSELRDLPAFPGYAVTADGKVWSYPKAPPPGKLGRKHNGQWIAPFHVRRDNALRVNLRLNGRRIGRNVAGLVAMVWS